MTVCATPWRHEHDRGQDREADLAVSVGGADPVELCLDCACIESRQAIARTRKAQVMGALDAAVEIRVGPVRS